MQRPRPLGARPAPASLRAPSRQLARGRPSGHRLAGPRPGVGTQVRRQARPQECAARGREVRNAADRPATIRFSSALTPLRPPAPSEREVHILAGLTRDLCHPSVAYCADIFEDPKTLFFVLELCDGGELYDCIIEKSNTDAGAFTETESAAIMHQLLSAVCWLYEEHNIVHRDLKPEVRLLLRSIRGRPAHPPHPAPSPEHPCQAPPLLQGRPRDKNHRLRAGPGPGTRGGAFPHPLRHHRVRTVCYSY